MDPKNDQQGAAGKQAPDQTASDQNKTGDDKGQGSKTVPIEALHEAREETKGLKATIATMQATLQGMQQQMQGQNLMGSPYGQNPNVLYPTSSPQGQQQYSMDDEDDDPRSIARKETMAILDYNNKVSAYVSSQIADVASKHDDYHVYASDIQSHLDRLPPAQKAIPNIVESAYYYMKGKNAGNVTSKQAAEMAHKMNAGVGAMTPDHAGSSGSGGDENLLSADEMKVAEGLGISADEYREAKRG